MNRAVCSSWAVLALIRARASHHSANAGCSFDIACAITNAVGDHRSHDRTSNAREHVPIEPLIRRR